MAGDNNVGLVICVWLSLSAVATVGSKLNVPRVLLPIFGEFSTNFTLEATEGGRYKWSCSRPDLVQLTPLDGKGECASRVSVTAVTKEAGHNMAIVLAEDLSTGTVLRCDVVVDVIASLNILTTTRELFMEEAPEAFEVRAYDDQGNEFTTLEGVRFEWAIDGRRWVKGEEGERVLRFMTFKESPYETPATLRHMEEEEEDGDEDEEKGAHTGHMVLVEGAKTGSARLSVRLAYPEYADVSTSEVQLVVVANLILEPAEAYVLVGDAVRFRLVQVKNGRLEEIELSSQSQYYLEVDDERVGSADRYGGRFRGSSSGTARVRLRDGGDSGDGGDVGARLPTATVHVTAPHHIGIAALPGRNWAAVAGERLDIVVEVFEAGGHKVHVGEDVRFATVVGPSDAFAEETRASSNGSWLTGRTVTAGSCEIRSTLIAPAFRSSSSSDRAQLVVFPRVAVRPAVVVLAWDESTRPRHETQLHANGGDGRFSWSTADRSLGSVSQSGLVRSYAPGENLVCAAMTRNQRHRDCSRVHVVPPEKLAIVGCVAEAEVGTVLELHVALYGRVAGVLVPLTECADVRMRVESESASFVAEATDDDDDRDGAATVPAGEACAVVRLVAASAGSARVTVVAYGRLSDNATVSAFERLVLIEPASGESALAVGTSRRLVFTGGPRPWAGRLRDHRRRVDSSSSDGGARLVVGSGTTDAHVVHVECRRPGRTVVALSVGNAPPFPRCGGRDSRAEATVICGVPVRVVLLAAKGAPAACPVGDDATTTTTTTARVSRDLSVEVRVEDSTGRALENATGLAVDWRLSDARLGSLASPNGLKTRERRCRAAPDVALPDGAYQIVRPTGRAGVLELTGALTGTDADADADADADGSGALRVRFVDDARLEPESIVLFDHPENAAFVAVLAGSGYFGVSVAEGGIVRASYSERDRRLEVVPVGAGGETRVFVRDLCLADSEPAVARVVVVRIASVDAEAPDSVEVGRSVEARVRLFDGAGVPVPLPSSVSLLELRVSHVGSEELVRVRLLDDGDNVVRFEVTGARVGDTALSFSAGGVVSSRPLPLRVFAPLRASPRNATVVVGGCLQLDVTGGPGPGAALSYEIVSDGRVSVPAAASADGVVRGLSAGVTTVRVTARLGDAAAAASEDRVIVNVVPLDGVRIRTPLTRWARGSVVPAWVSPLPEILSPLALGCAAPDAVSFRWSTGDCPGVVAVRGVLSAAGVDALSDLAVRLHGLSAGACSLSLEAFVADGRRTLVDRVDLEVYERLTVERPPSSYESVLRMAPGAEFRLRLDRSGPGPFAFAVDYGASVARVSADGVVTAVGPLGRALVVASTVDGLRQSVAVEVRVLEPRYVMASLEPDDWATADRIVVGPPVGAAMRLALHHHDETGAELVPPLSAGGGLRLSSGRRDALHVAAVADSNGTLLMLHAREPGPIAFEVRPSAGGSPVVADYVGLRAVPVASRDRELRAVVGDVVCVTGVATHADARPGRWSSADRASVRALDPIAGVFRVIGVASDGGEIVDLTYSPAPASPAIRLRPLPIAGVDFRRDRLAVGNARPVERVLFRLRSAGDGGSGSNLIADWNCGDRVSSLLEEQLQQQEQRQQRQSPFRCRLDRNDAFRTRPGFDPISGLHSCDLEPLRPPPPGTEMTRTNLTLTVVVVDATVESEPLELAFWPAAVLSATELHLTDARPVARLTVRGLPEVLESVRVSPTDPSLVAVGSPEDAPSSRTFPVRLLDYHPRLLEREPLAVDVTSELTGQRQRVPLRPEVGAAAAATCFVDSSRGSVLGGYLYRHREALVVLLSLFVVFVATFYVYSHYAQPVVHVCASPLSSLSTSTTTFKMSPSRSGDGSFLTTPEVRRNKRFL